MKDIYKKMCNLKISQKIIIALIVTFLISIFNFFYYNYQILKLPKSERNYTLNLEKLELTNAEYKDGKIYTTSNQAIIDLNLHDKYVKKLVITYDNDNSFNIVYSGQVANNYGLYKDNSTYEETCYNEFNVCGTKFNKRINDMKLQINRENISISDIKVINSIEFNFVTFIFWTIGINLLLLILFNSKYFSKNKHILTFIMSISIGAIFLAVTHNIPATALDGQIHYYNYASFLVESDKMSVSDYYNSNAVINFYNINTSEERKAFKKFIDDNGDKYIYTLNNVTNIFKTNKLNYLPIGTVMKINDILGVPKSLSVFMCRFVQLLIYCLVISFAVKKIPTHKNLLMVIAILPQSLFLASSFSYDPTVTAFTLLSFAAFVDEYHNKDRKIKLSNVLIFVLAGLYGIFPKAIYSVFLLLMLLLPKSKFKNKKQYNYFRILIICTFAIGMASFMIAALFDPSIVNDVRGGAVSSSEQLKLILKAPLSFIKTFWDGAILASAEKLFSSATFGNLSYYGGMGFDFSYLLFVAAMFIAFLDNNEYKKAKLLDRFKMIAIYFIIVCFIWGALYLAFTPVGHDRVNGVQNRYFISLIFPILYALSNSKLKIDMKDKSILSTCMSLCLLSSLLLIYIVIIKVYFI